MEENKQNKTEIFKKKIYKFNREIDYEENKNKMKDFNLKKIVTT